MTAWLFVLCAALLSIERLAYIWIVRHPARFCRWCDREVRLFDGDPVEAMRLLFVVFKGIQAGVFVGWWFVHAGGPPSPSGVPPLVLGLALVIMGQTLTLTAFGRLGSNGVFYGSRFGRVVPWCRQFPYSLMSHPQYVGAVMTIWGLFIMMRFPAPDWYWLPILETGYYAAGSYLER